MNTTNQNDTKQYEIHKDCGFAYGSRWHKAECEQVASKEKCGNCVEHRCVYHYEVNCSICTPPPSTEGKTTHRHSEKDTDIVEHNKGYNCGLPSCTEGKEEWSKEFDKMWKPISKFLEREIPQFEKENKDFIHKTLQAQAEEINEEISKMMSSLSYTQSKVNIAYKKEKIDRKSRNNARKTLKRQKQILKSLMNHIVSKYLTKD